MAYDLDEAEASSCPTKGTSLNDTRELSVRELLRDRNLQIIFSVTCMVVMGVTSIAPTFPDILNKLPGTSTANIGLLITFFTIPGVFLTPIIGVFADRYGRKRMLVPALFFFGVSGICCGLARDFHWLLFFRFLQGLGAAPLGALNLTIISDMYQGRTRTTALGLNAGALSLAVASYPVLGGGLAAINWHVPFFLPVLAFPVGFWVLFSLNTPEPKVESNLRSYLSSMATGLSDRRVLALFFATLCTFVLIYGPFLTYMPIRMGHGFGATPFQIGLLMSISAFVTGLIASQVGNLSRRFSEAVLFKGAFLIYGLACVCLSLMPSLWWFALPIFLFGMGQGMNVPCTQSLLSDLAPPELRGGFMSMNATVLRLGQTIGPPIMAGMFALGGINWVFFGGAAIALLAFAAAAAFMK